MFEVYKFLHKIGQLGGLPTQGAADQYSGINKQFGRRLGHAHVGMQLGVALAERDLLRQRGSVPDFQQNRQLDQDASQGERCAFVKVSYFARAVRQKGQIFEEVSQIRVLKEQRVLADLRHC